MVDRKVRITAHQFRLLAALVITWLDHMGDEMADHRLTEARRLLIYCTIPELRELLERLGVPMAAE